MVGWEMMEEPCHLKMKRRLQSVRASVRKRSFVSIFSDPMDEGYGDEPIFESEPQIQRC